MADTPLGLGMVGRSSGAERMLLVHVVQQWCYVLDRVVSQRYPRSSTNHTPTAGTAPSFRSRCGVAESKQTESPGIRRWSSKPSVRMSSPMMRYPYSVPVWRMSSPLLDEVPPG